jgi:hypothetical protein
MKQRLEFYPLSKKMNSIAMSSITCLGLKGFVVVVIVVVVAVIMKIKRMIEPYHYICLFDKVTSVVEIPAVMALFVIITPFGSSVVPLVYMIV